MAALGLSGGPVAVADDSPLALCTMEIKDFATVPGSPAGRVVQPGATLTGLAVGQRQDVVDWRMVEGWDVADGVVVVRPNPAGIHVVETVGWLKDGNPTYSGSPTRKVTREDLGSTFVQVVALSAREVSTCPARLGSTQAWTVLAKPTITAKADRSSLATANAVVKVKVKADGVARPTGTVTVTVGAKKSATVTLTRADKGTVDVTLPKLSRGTHKVRTTFTDTTGKIQDGSAKTFTAKVT